MAKDYLINMVLEGHETAIDEVIETFVAEVEDFGLTAGGGSTAIVNNRYTYEFVIEDVESVSTALVIIHSTVSQATLFDIQAVKLSVKEVAAR